MSQIRLPAVIYATQPGHKTRDDLNCGDMTEHELKTVYGLDDVSAKVNPYNFTRKSEISLTPFMDYSAFNFPTSSVTDPFDHDPALFRRLHDEMMNTLNRQQCSDILFDEMRALSKPFALYGAYSELIVKMINHLQGNSGTVFRDYLLNKALKDQIDHDFSASSSLNTIKATLLKRIHWERNIYPQDDEHFFGRDLNLSVLPKFRRFKDNFNGMGITVHDTYATQITLKELTITDGKYKALVNYKVQDHFGLDKTDISNIKFRNLRFFRIWFVLQRWEKFVFKPFITEMNSDIYFYGGIR
ncbi:DUF3289 family protein [Rahnella victoriana]|uniref:DUF3289 family protein n=1 Tax=Rahnella victoriana TaxID=1510570 RepID=UPI001E4BC051|nr:DUF3289 family protein [Rahnella victoriana]UHM92315.1 DUF3289 family protein [Rahnella victoriana]